MRIQVVYASDDYYPYGSYGTDYYAPEQAIEDQLPGDPGSLDFEGNDAISRPSPEELGFHLGDAVRIVTPPQDNDRTRGMVGVIEDFDVAANHEPMPGGADGSMLVSLPDGREIVVYPEEVERV